MKLLFISNYINHHQIPFCNAMYALLGDEFAFLQTEPMEEERIRMGWQQDVDRPYLIRYYENPQAGDTLIAESKVVLFGGTDDESYIAERLRNRQPVVRYSERIYKEGQWKAVSPRGLRRKYLDHTRYRGQEVYMLCSGAYVPSDFHIVRAYPGKMLRWGYFPETKVYDVDQLMQEKKPASILWAARFIDWKHPELALEVAKYLKEKGLAFHLNIVGGGNLTETVEKLIDEYELGESVSLLGFQTPTQVRGLMEESAIYLTTSDRREGWGAVINEAMNSGCAVVADHMMGAAPFLIEQGQNGYVYRDGDLSMLCEEVERLVRDPGLCRKLGTAAYETIQKEWNAETAAKRLVAFCIRKGFLGTEDLADEQVWRAEDFDGKEKEPALGPCSPAPVIGERQMFGKLMEKNR